MAQNPLEIDPKTGFLQAPTDNRQDWYFTAEKKLKLLQIAEQIQKESNSWPDFSTICEKLNIHPRTLDRHLMQDQAFAEQFRDLMLRGKWKLESMMFKMSSKNPMYCFGWLRKWFPNEYDPDRKTQVSIDIRVIDDLTNKLKELSIDTEADPPVKDG